MLEHAPWTCDPYDVARAELLHEQLGLSRTSAAILVRRGIDGPDAAQAFLDAGERSEPSQLPGVDAAAQLILGHVARGSRILVFGDYDVDGVCSTAIAVRALRALGAQPSWRLPSREEGYGLSQDAIRELANAGTQLLVTVDCGVTAVEEIALARDLGMDVVVADHHRVGETLPDCPVVHPALGDGTLAELCAAGVVHKLARELRARSGADASELASDLDLVGLATVCDMVPLRGENRRLAREGLAALARTERPGIRALMAVAGVEPGELDARAASFRLGPRINAAGRISRADAALELVLTDSQERAQQVAQELDGLNMDRRETERLILAEAEAQCLEQSDAGALVVAGEGWHHGVVGIVAARLVERHHRPCIAIAVADGVGRGSARSIAGYDVHAGIAAGEALLRRFGGHTMAAGLEIEARAIPEFRAAFAAHAGAALAPADLLPVEHVDAVVAVGGLTLAMAEELERLGPFGAANPAPRLLVAGARLENVVAMGQERDHARFSIVGGGARAGGVAFRTAHTKLAELGREPTDAVVDLERNRFNGAVEARVVLRSGTRSVVGTVTDIGDGDLWRDLEGALALESAVAEGAGELAPSQTGRRTVIDRENAGIVGTCGDLCSSGDSVLLAVAHVGRRRAALEAVVAGMADGPLAVVSWDQLLARPELAERFDHVVAIDPPATPRFVGLLASLPGIGCAHIAWGSAERAFALEVWRSELTLRGPLVELFRELREAGALADAALATALRGHGRYARPPRLCARLLAVLTELGLAEVSAERRLSLGEQSPTDLEHSRTYRSCVDRLALLERTFGDGSGESGGLTQPLVATG